MNPAVVSANVQPLPIATLAVAVAVAAVAICLWKRTARFCLAASYILTWSLLVLAQAARGASPARFYLWTGSAEWAGLLLVTAIVGWLTRRPRVAAAIGIRVNDDHFFMVAQALLMATIALLVGWIAIDFSFDGVGAGFALFGFVGRACACPSALMLLGASIMMAWQSTGRWRAAWQFAAMANGVLFTSSIGWARVDAASAAPWLDRQVVLMISTGMMTMMTGIGLPRGLPQHSDWITRGRQAAPIFACAALLLMVMMLMEKAIAGP